MSGSDGPRGRGTRLKTAVRALLLGSLVGAVSLANPIPAPPVAQRAAAVPPAVPEAGFAPGWAKAGPLRTFNGEDLFNQIDGGAELFLEFGFVRLRLQAYAKGRAELTLNAYEMEGAASALGVYLMKMGRESPFAEIGARNSSEEIQLTVLKGRYFVQVDNLGEVAASRAETVALANAFLAGVAEESAETPLDLLPAEGRVPGSERLIRGPYGLQSFFTFGEGDVLKLEAKIFGAVASYGAGSAPASLRVIVPYPAEDQAGLAFEGLLANLDPYLKVLDRRPGAFVFEDHRSRYGIVERKGKTLDLQANLDVRPKI